MMPGVGFQEMILLVLVAIVVVGPKDLPLMMRKFGRFTGKMRAMAFEFRQGLDELGRQAELDELRKEVAALKKHTGIEELTREVEEDRIAIERDVQNALATEENRIAPPAPDATTTPPASDASIAETSPAAEPVSDYQTSSAEPQLSAAPVKQDTPA